MPGDRRLRFRADRARPSLPCCPGVRMAAAPCPKVGSPRPLERRTSASGAVVRAGTLIARRPRRARQGAIRRSPRDRSLRRRGAGRCRQRTPSVRSRRVGCRRGQGRWCAGTGRAQALRLPPATEPHHHQPRSRRRAQGRRRVRSPHRARPARLPGAGTGGGAQRRHGARRALPRRQHPPRGRRAPGGNVRGGARFARAGPSSRLRRRGGGRFPLDGLCGLDAAGGGRLSPW